MYNIVGDVMETMNQLEQTEDKSRNDDASAVVDTDDAASSCSSCSVADSTAGESEPGCGVVFSDRFALHKSPVRGHEERPARLEAIRKAAEEHGLWDELRPLVAREATDAELLTVHSKGYLRKLARFERSCNSAGEQGGAAAVRQVCTEFTMEHEDVYLNEHTVACARLAAGACLEATRAVHSGEVGRAVAVVRPPGHHAEAHCAQGFCVLNNVALAAKYATDVLGLRRVLVVDWDVHHGNGTQRTFLDDPRVLYFSVHRHDFGKFYPAAEAGAPLSVGRGAASGTTVNVAWNGPAHGDAEYVAAWDRVLLPIAREFSPELVIVSAGFDAARGDKMGCCDVTPEGYATMTRELMSLAGGRLVVVLEGGYDLTSLGASMTACMAEMLGRTSSAEHANRLEHARRQPLRPEALDAIEATVRAQKPYWTFEQQPAPRKGSIVAARSA